MATKPVIPNNIETLGAAVRYLREKRGMTLRALAGAIKVSAPFLSDIEHNRRSTDKLPAFAKALDVELGELERFDGRLTADMRDWIASNPALVALLKDMRASGRKPEELRASILGERRNFGRRGVTHFADCPKASTFRRPRGAQ